LEDGKRLSGYQKIRVKVIRTAGYQVKKRRWDEGGVVRVAGAGEWWVVAGLSMLVRWLAS